VTYNEDGKRKLPNEQFSGLEEYDPRTSIAETYVNSVVRWRLPRVLTQKVETLQTGK
jgi:hypothetical protein